MVDAALTEVTFRPFWNVPRSILRGEILPALAKDPEYLRAHDMELVDVGAGTGANRDYLAPRLPLAQEWVVVDHDADLLGHVGHGDAVRVEAVVLRVDFEDGSHWERPS